jgi:site-specific recombinase XerC
MTHLADDSLAGALTLGPRRFSARPRLIGALVRLRWASIAYLDALEYEDAATNTLAAYEYVLGLFAVEHADLTLRALEPPRGGGVMRAFLDRHWRRSSPATKAQRLAIVRSFLTWLVGEGLLGANPAQNIRAPKRKRKVRDLLSARTSTD